jgi:hypothetical protein
MDTTAAQQLIDGDAVYIRGRETIRSAIGEVVSHWLAENGHTAYRVQLHSDYYIWDAGPQQYERVAGEGVCIEVEAYELEEVRH